MAVAAWAQSLDSFRPDWRRIGGTAVDYSLASVATGPVDRVWFSADGERVFIRTSAGQVFETADGEAWKVSPDAAPDDGQALVVPPEGFALPEPDVRLRAATANRARVYAFGRGVHRSDDGGQSWTDLTDFRGRPIIGADARDLAVSPKDADVVLAANGFGVWRSVDGGLSWSGLNETLPNLPLVRIAGLPEGSHGARLLLEGGVEVEWAPGEKRAWRPAPPSEKAGELATRRALSTALGAEITAVASISGFVYAGSQDGRIWVSQDDGRTWLPPREAIGAPIEGFHADPGQARRALAVAGAAAAGRKAPRVLRTFNGGLFWDDLTANLPEGALHAVTADGATGGVYVAGEAGVFFTLADLAGGGPPAPWVKLSAGLPAASALDVELDPAGNQLYVALAGYGIFAATAPHRILAPRVVNAADLSERPAAPGALVSVLGRRIAVARSGRLTAPVLAASDLETQIQIPFEARGPQISLSLEAPSGRFALGLPLESVAPAVFVDRDGTPMIIDADSGLLLDTLRPARSGARVQILATGLGQVRPAWPTGLAAPLESPPAVVAPVRVLLDRQRVEVTRATLAPGYVGFYLIEIQLPELVNAGPAELYVEVDGRASNRVRLYLAPNGF